MPETIGQIELYAFWLLLNHVKGPKSYPDIQTMIHSRILLLLLVWSRMIIYGLNV